MFSIYSVVFSIARRVVILCRNLKDCLIIAYRNVSKFNSLRNVVTFSLLQLFTIQGDTASTLLILHRPYDGALDFLQFGA